MADHGSARNGRARIESVDALRGFALIGVGLVHTLEQFAATALTEDISQAALTGTLDYVIAGVNQLFFVGKFYMIFSFLFGLSFFIQLDARSRSGEPFQGRFAWRLVLLFAFGYLHHLFHRGDILMLYAVLGFSLLLMNRLSTRALVALAIVMFLGLGRYVGFALFGDSLPLTKADAPENLAYLQTLSDGSLWDVFAVNFAGGIDSLLRFQFGIIGRGYVTFGLFLLGLALGRIGFFSDLAAHRRLLVRAVGWSGAACVLFIVLTGLLFSQVQQPASLSTWTEAVALTCYDLFNLSLATVLSGAFLLAALSPRLQRLTRVLAPYGRMALTNYLLQALIGTALFYGWGLGQLGLWPNRILLAMGIAIAIVQVVASRIWMKHFLYGPFEWLWRSLTLRRMIAIRPKTRS